jgi:hypothetical protein
MQHELATRDVATRAMSETIRIIIYSDFFVEWSKMNNERRSIIEEVGRSVLEEQG